MHVNLHKHFWVFLNHVLIQFLIQPTDLQILKHNKISKWRFTISGSTIFVYYQDTIPVISAECLFHTIAACQEILGG